MPGTEHETAESNTAAVLALPFVCETQEGVRFWNAEECGDQSTDIDRGAYFAKLAIDVARRFDMPELIALVMRDMIAAGRFTALEAGFLGAVASAARSGSMN